MMDPGARSRSIKAWADALGFSYTGIARAEFLEADAPRLENWLKEGRHGSMTYMENWFDKRLDPRKLVPGAKSVVSLLYNYYPNRFQRPDAPQISKYAYGKDYHFVLKRKLKELLHRIREEIGAVEGRAFVDSGPVMERSWAARSGIGWVGKHSLLIHPDHGSFLFIAELIIDLELEPDAPLPDRCGTCTRCIEACPTDAITPSYVVDGSKCISYLTIELKDDIPDAFSGKMADWMFGCDICQDVCPWNRFSIGHMEPEFEPNDRLADFSRDDWMEITEEVFAEIFRKSAVKRTKYAGLKRNLEFLQGGNHTD